MSYQNNLVYQKLPTLELPNLFVVLLFHISWMVLIFYLFFEITVYPQKQQSYGPYGYAAYPGPAAYYGSQYGLPYNQY